MLCSDIKKAELFYADRHSEMLVCPFGGLGLLICETRGFQSRVPSLLSCEDVVCEVITGPSVPRFGTGSPA